MLGGSYYWIILFIEFIFSLKKLNFIKLLKRIYSKLFPLKKGALLSTIH